MTVPTTGLDETSPAGSQDISLGDNRIREYKTQNREVLEVDHNYPTSGSDADAGTHKKITLTEVQSSDPTNAANKGFLYLKDVSSVVELFWMDESGNVVQLTTGGAINGMAGKISADGTIPLTANWDAGSYKITAETLESDVATGTAPLTVASTTVVSNLNADQLDGSDASDLTMTIEDYGSSNSTGSSVSQGNLIIQYGYDTSIAGSGSQAITNLNFASSTSYNVSVTTLGSSETDENPTVVRDSGSQFTIHNHTTSARGVMWIAIGT